MLLEQEYAMRQENTTVGCSLCSDDVSQRPGGLWQETLKKWGKVFPLGGLGGAPFIGKTGFEGFLAGVPEGSDAMVLFGPHVGMLPTGQMGKYLFRGKKEPVLACKACVTAYEQCLAKPENEDVVSDPLDLQQAWLRAQLAPHAREVAKAKVPMAALAYQCYDLVAQKLFSIADFHIGARRLVLLGGIQISMPEGCEDHFLPIDFEVLQEGQEPKDHMDTFNKW